MTDHGIESLKYHEGLRLKAYLCPSKVWTIGFGHTSDRHHEVTEGMTITLDEAYRLLLLDISEAEADARRLLPNFNDLTPRRQDAMVNMAFQLGYFRLSKFVNTLNYIRTGRYAQAAEGLKNSAWFRQTQKDRTDYVVNAIREG